MLAAISDDGFCVAHVKPRNVGPRRTKRACAMSARMSSVCVSGRMPLAGRARVRAPRAEKRSGPRCRELVLTTDRSTNFSPECLGPRCESVIDLVPSVGYAPNVRAMAAVPTLSPGPWRNVDFDEVGEGRKEGPEARDWAIIRPTGPSATHPTKV